MSQLGGRILLASRRNFAKLPVTLGASPTATSDPASNASRAELEKLCARVPAKSFHPHLSAGEASEVLPQPSGPARAGL